MSNIREITPEQYENEVSEAQGVVLVDIWGDDCPPCFTVAEWLKQLDKEWAGQIAIKKMYIANPEIPLMAQLNVRGIPTVILFKNGQEQARLARQFTQGDLREIVAPFLA